MYKKIILTLILSLFSVFAFAQSHVNVYFNGVDKIKVDGAIILNIYYEDTDLTSINGKITTEADRQLEFDHNDTELIITRHVEFSFKKVVLDSIVLNMKISSIKSIEAKSGAEVNFGESFSSDSITFKASSSSTISAIVDTKRSILEAKGKSKILLSGYSMHIKVNVSNKASVNTIQTKCDILDAISTTNGECFVRADKLLDLKANTWGNIFYKGVAEEIIKSVSTLGHIEKF